MIGYRFHGEAQAEFREVALFYESKLPSLGSSFANEVEHAVRLILTHPDVGTPVGHSLRRVLVKRFPYAIIYRRQGDEIFILALSHPRPGETREPGRSTFLLLSHEEGGEPRSKGQTSGKGRPDMTDCWGEPWEALEATNPITTTSAVSFASCGRQRILVKPHLLDSESLWHTMGGTEEPDESITHVRVCGGPVG